MSVERDTFHIISAAVAQPGCKVHLTFSDGVSGEVDFAPVAERGGVFAKLSDPRLFSQVRIGERGRSLEWPDDLDFCADALWLDCRKALQFQASPVRL